MFAALGSALATEAFKAFFAALFTNLFGFLDKKNQDATHEDLGASKVANKINQETINALKRANDAAVNAPGVDDTITDLESGRF
jgi:hypothetical protein